MEQFFTFSLSLSLNLTISFSFSVGHKTSWADSEEEMKMFIITGPQREWRDTLERFFNQSVKAIQPEWKQMSWRSAVAADVVDFSLSLSLSFCVTIKTI